MRGSVKLPKGKKLATDKDGKVVIVDDFESQRRAKPAGQQFWKKDSVKVKR